jgi:hypothetical protein
MATEAKRPGPRRIAQAVRESARRVESKPSFSQEITQCVAPQLIRGRASDNAWPLCTDAWGLFLTNHCPLARNAKRQKTLANERNSLSDERHSPSGREGPVRDAIGIRTPVHRTGDHAVSGQHLLHNAYMSPAICSLYPGLQVDDRPWCRLGGNMPAILHSTRSPLPCHGIRCPGDKYAMQLVIALIGPPGATSIREHITALESRGWRDSGNANWFDTGNTDDLTHVDQIGVGDVIVRCKARHTRMVLLRYPA